MSTRPTVFCNGSPGVSFSWLVAVEGAEWENGVKAMRAFPVRMPSGVRYWTVLDTELAVVGVADAFLRQGRFGRDGAGSTTKAYAGGIALFLRWGRPTGRGWGRGGGAAGPVMVGVAPARAAARR